MKKIFTLFLVVLTMVLSTTNAFACENNESVVSEIELSSYDNCPYKSTHGIHNPHSSNFDFYIRVYPDYTRLQLHQISYYYCKNCNYICCVIDEYFGNLIGLAEANNSIE